ncbi:FHA domain-containing protein (plasmid) [Nostoc sp. C052]|uniref:FHA domain-containing protein n=1 Tax=Nostoc sp. C052 TaxID=2576902 RepID=UPI0015C30CE3|nr:FHA domain-containing protein [Nostoc sp. C052]QLE46548.1 FHA domain-containing protein [Nostoc sp. C052]
MEVKQKMQEEFYLKLFLIGGEVLRINLGRQTHLIGRNKNLTSYIEENFICLNYGFISRLHSSLVMYENKEDDTYYYVIWDGVPLEKRSKSGVFVNGKRIHWTRLESGDVITFAESESGDSFPRLIFTTDNINLSGEEETAAHEIGNNA